MIKDFEKVISGNELPNVLFIYGEEEFLVEDAFNKIIEKFVVDEFSYENLNIPKILANKEKFDLSNLLDIFNSTPMFGGDKIVSVNGLEAIFTKAKDTSSVNLLNSYLVNPNPSVKVIIRFINPSVFNKPQKLKAPYNTLTEKSKVLYFKKFSESELTEYIKSKITQSGKTINDESSYFLRVQCNNDLSLINQEIEKIISFNKDTKSITIDNISHTLGVEKEYNIFELTKAISNKDLAKSLIIVTKISETKDALRPIISQLYNYFNKLYKLIELKQKGVSNQDISKELGVHSFFLTEYYTALNKLGEDCIVSAFEKIAQADEKIKTSQGSIVYIIQSLITSILK